MLKEHGVNKDDADSAEKELMEWVRKNISQLLSVTMTQPIVGIKHTENTQSMADRNNSV